MKALRTPPPGWQRSMVWRLLRSTTLWPMPPVVVLTSLGMRTGMRRGLPIERQMLFSWSLLRSQMAGCRASSQPANVWQFMIRATTATGFA
jgi:hypothetical protein